MRNIRKLDIDLLVTLEALLVEGNVTRVAQRLHLSQPTVSVRLAKLRRLFGDRLLVPGPGGLQPTARGHELLMPLREALHGVERMLGAQLPFDPAASELTWRVAASDYAQSVILAALLPRLRRLAPGIRIAVHPLVPAEIGRGAERGEIDVAFMTSDIVPANLRSVVLFSESYRLIARSRHPRLNGAPTLAQFCKLDHILVSPEGGGFRGPTDILVEARGRTRHVALSVPHFLMVPDLVRRSDMVAMLPSRLLAGRLQGLQQLDAPVEPPHFEMVMAWHERVHMDPAQAWLREQIRNALPTQPRAARG